MMGTVQAQPAEQARQDAASGPAEPLRAPPGLAWGSPSRPRRLHRAALGVALAAHAGLLYGLAREPADDLAGGGGQLDAISVTIVNSTALESRDVNHREPSAPAAAEAVEVNDGAAENAPAAPQPQPEEREEKQAEQEKAPDQPAPMTAIVEVPKEAQKDAQEEARKEASTPSTLGGVAARGDADSAAKQSALAAASVGAMRDYARYVAQALAKARPKGFGGTGTVKVKLVIAPGGGLTAVEIAKSSGNERLDDMALAAVQRATLPVPPPGMTQAQLTYEVPYHFR